MTYHSYNLSAIKAELKASYVAYERVKDTYHLKVIKDGKHRYFLLEGTPDDVTPQKYKNLQNLLKETYGGL